jgi:hypothetical protein
MDVLGPRYKKDAGKVKQKLEDLNPDEVEDIEMK